MLEQFGSERIFFKPEASPLGPNLSKLRDATQGTARIFEGSGGINLVDCYRRGIVGTMPGMDLLDGIVALWDALEAGDEERIYQLSLPISALVALELQAGLDGFLAIEKHLLVKRGIFNNTIQLPPVSWELDPETRSEVDRLFARLQTVFRNGTGGALRTGCRMYCIVVGRDHRLTGTPHASSKNPELTTVSATAGAGAVGRVVADFHDCPIAETWEDHVAESQFRIVIGVAAVENDVMAVGAGKRIGINQLHAVIGGGVFSAPSCSVSRVHLIGRWGRTLPIQRLLPGSPNRIRFECRKSSSVTSVSFLTGR